MRRIVRPAPRVAVVFLQPACNLHCTFCVTEDDFEPIHPRRLRHLLEELAAAGTKTVTFGGGEPFLWHGDLPAAARRARRLGLLTQVGTNATVLPDGVLHSKLFDRWVLPLESSDPAIHDAMRVHSTSHHALLLERLEELGRAGRTVTLSTVLTRTNLDGLGDLAIWIEAYHRRFDNVHAWHLYRFLPFGRGGRVHRRELEIPEETYQRAAERIRGLCLPFAVYRRTDMYHSRTVDFFWQQDGCLVRGGDQLAARGGEARS